MYVLCYVGVKTQANAIREQVLRQAVERVYIVIELKVDLCQCSKQDTAAG